MGWGGRQAAVNRSADQHRRSPVYGHDCTYLLGAQSSVFLPAAGASLAAQPGSFWPGTILKRASPPRTLSRSLVMPAASPFTSLSSPWSSMVKRRRLWGLKMVADGVTVGANIALSSFSTARFNHMNFILAPLSLSCEVNCLERPVSISVSAAETSPSFR